MQEEHTEISPSGLYRIFEGVRSPASGKWEMKLRCPGCIAMCRKVPKKPSSKYAAEGSAAHYLGEYCLKRKVLSAYERLGIVITVGGGRDPLTQWEVTEEMADAVQIYLNHIYDLREHSVGGIFKIEEKMNIDWLVPGIKGKGDHILIEPLGRMCVDDYKHGAGVPVEVEGNSQEMTYGLMALGKDNPHMVEEVVLTITQPRSPHWQGSIRSVTIDTDELYQWGYDVFVPGVQAAMQPNAQLMAGDWCRWCDASGVMDDNNKYVCPAKQDQADNAIVDMFGSPTALDAGVALVPPDPFAFDGDTLNNALMAADIVEDHIKAVRAEAYRRHNADAHNAPSGFKLIAGSLSNRAYAEGIDVYDAVKTILPRSEVHDPEKVKSPAQLEAALKRKGLKPAEVKPIMLNLIADRVRSKPKLAPVTHKSPAVQGTVEEIFGSAKNATDAIFDN
jgi:hypothetical protein